MTHVPNRPCGVCRRIYPGGNCPTHPRKGGYRPRRPSVTEGVYGRLWRAVRDAVLVAAGYRCTYCGGAGNTGDHVVPTTRGGQTSILNVVSACSTCNTSKGNRTLTEWIDSGCAPAGARDVRDLRVSARLPV